jgi:hypothetical protein
MLPGLAMKFHVNLQVCDTYLTSGMGRISRVGKRIKFGSVVLKNS